MVKINKLISLDADVHNSLSDMDNASKYINDLVKDALKAGKGKKLEQLQEDLSQERILIAEAQDREGLILFSMKELEEKEAKTQELFKGLPEQMVEDFSLYPDMSEAVFKNRWDGMYKELISFEDAHAAWKASKE